MAIGATIYKAEINLSDLNIHKYEDYSLTIAKHPSENEHRMMVRLIAYLLSASENLEFTKGISTQEEPDIWEKDLTGEILNWIELGLPELKRVRQACGKSKTVKIYSYHDSKYEEWIQKNKNSFSDLKKLEVYHLKISSVDELTALSSRTMNLSCMIEENIIYLSNDESRVEIELINLK